MRYHRTDDGNVNPCQAKTPERCLYSESRHFDSVEEAQSDYEQEMKNQETNSVSKKSQTSDKRVKTLVNRVLPPGSDLYKEGQKQQKIMDDARDHETMITPQQFEAHHEYITEVTELLNKQGLSTDRIYAQDALADSTVYTKEREALHREIIDEYMEQNKHVPNNGEAVIAGGLGGAGKGSTMSKTGVADPKKYATINPDDVKEIMAKKGMIPKIPGALPMEVSTLVHEEASHVSGRLMTKLLSQKKNILLDVTMGSEKSSAKKIDRLKNNGYKVNAFFVDIEPDTSIQRGEGRYRDGLNKYFLTGDGSEARPLPSHVVDNQRTKSSMRSKNAENLVKLVSNGKIETTPRVFDNMGKEPVEKDYKKFARGYLYK